MSQLNIHMTPSFEKDLNRFMRIRHINTKSEAIRVAIKEGITHATSQATPVDFNSWLGLGIKAPTNKKNKFNSDDDIWK